MNRRGATEGFSLVEMLVVLAILSLTAAAIYAGSNWRQPRETLGTLSQKIAHAAATASLRALSKGETARIEVNFASRVVSGGQASREIIVPERFKISVLTGAGLIEQAQAGAIEFYSDGTSSGGEIALQAGDGSASTVRIFWLTGAVTISRGKTQ